MDSFDQLMKYRHAEWLRTHVAAASALVRLVNDEAHRRNLGRQARSYALANFTWPAKYLAVYRGT